jgi:hypothetical protein
MDDRTLVISAIVGSIILLGLGLLVLARLRSRATQAPALQELGPAPIQSAPPAGPYLEGRDTVAGPHYFPLTQPNNLVGRAEHADIRIDECFAKWETVSREHAWIKRLDDRTIIEDNDSTNGVAVNGRRTGRNLLKDGWRLEIGGVVLIYHAGGEDDAP